MDIAMDYVQWIWLVLALFFFLAELLIPDRSMVPLGIGAILAALMAFVDLDFIWQIGIFALISAIGYTLILLRTRRVSRPHETVYGVDRVVGKEAIVLVAINPKTAQGRVRVDREQWPADSESGQAIADGSTVQVLAVRGDRVLVRPLPNEKRR